MYPYPPQPQAPQPRKLDNNQRMAISQQRLAYIKSECHQAVHPTVIRDRLREVIDVLEFLLFGQISNEQPNLIPGAPANAMDDPSKTRVEFYGGPQPAQQPANPFAAPSPWGAPAPSAPVTTGDVNFTPSAAPSAQVEYGPVGGASAGQRVEYFDGPPRDNSAPVSNEPHVTAAPNTPTRTTEAGGPVAPTPPYVPPHSNGAGPQSREEAQRTIPIPLAD